MPATARRDKRVDQRSKDDETALPLGRSLLLTKSLSRVPKVAATTPLAVRAAVRLQNVLTPQAFRTNATAMAVNGH
jgi:hypothetical protein